MGQLPSIPTDLRIENELNCLGVDQPKPRVGWCLPADAAEQVAYQLQMATSRAKLFEGNADVWDSGEVESPQSQAIPYEGKPLTSGQQVFWRVRVRSDQNLASDWSEVNAFTMGILADLDWQGARWITAVSACLDPGNVSNPDGEIGDRTRPIGIDCDQQKEKDLLALHVPAQSILLRRRFVVKPGLVRALLFSSGLAHYEATIDSRPVSDRLLSPGWSNYRKTILYDTTDVTHLAGTGEHELRMLLGNGMYSVYYTPDRYVKFVNTFGAQKAIALLLLQYSDGTSEHVKTDANWEAGTSPMTYSNVFGGEDYDQRLEDEPNWQAAMLFKSPGGVLRGLSSSAPPVRSIEILKPKSITPHSPEVLIYDLGQNASIMPSITAHGPAGSSITISPSELLGADGSIDRSSCVQGKGGPAYWKYTFDGRGAATLFPKFFYQGGRYLQVERTASPAGGGLPDIDDLHGVVVHSAAEPVGTFSCSNPLFNRIHSLVRWAQRSNMIHNMTDCPAREKLGWLEQLHLNGPSLRYNFRLDQFFNKALNDIADSQEESGMVPNIAPEFFSADPKVGTGSFRFSPEWSSSLIIAAWQQYLFHADIALLHRFYPAMVRYFDYLASIARDHLLEKGLGDWYDVGPKPAWGSQLTPPAFTASSIYFLDATLMAKVATLLHRNEDAARFTESAKHIRSAVNTRFRDPKTRLYTIGFPLPQGSQCATAMAVALEIAERDDRNLLIDALVQDIRDHDNGLTAGDVGYRFVLRALADAGRSDVIFQMNTNPDRPGYAMQLAKGATALTEKWDGSVGAFGSQNHFMLGQINEWFFHDLAGIRPDEQQPGFRHIIIQPQPCGDIEWTKAQYRSSHGTISVEWRKAEGKLQMDLLIPPNTHATVYPDAKSTRSIQLRAGNHHLAE